jgi:hypothetical protein
MATGFETLCELDFHHAKLLREAQTWRLSCGKTTGWLDLVELPPLPKLPILYRAGLAALSTRHSRVAA